MRPGPRVLSPAEQAETDRVAEEVLREIKRVLSRPSALAHPVQADLPVAHSEACDAETCRGECRSP